MPISLMGSVTPFRISMRSPLNPPENPSRGPQLTSTNCVPDNTGRIFSKRVSAYERSTVILSFKSNDANAMRAFINTIRLKGDKAPSQSLIARRAVQLYLCRLEMLRREDPSAFITEVEALEASGQRIKCLTVVDEFSRESLAIDNDLCPRMALSTKTATTLPCCGVHFAQSPI